MTVFLKMKNNKGNFSKKSYFLCFSLGQVLAILLIFGYNRRG